VSLIDTVKDLLTPERVDVHRCDECEEFVQVDPGEPPGDCPACGAGEFTLVNRNAKA
jgi:rubrerythrin